MLKLIGNLIEIAVYSAAYLLVVSISYKLISAVIPYDTNEALTGEKNLAMAVVIGSLFVGIALVFLACIF